MKITLTLSVQVEVEASSLTDEQATTDALYETDKALDYWFSHTDRPMSNRGVTLKGRKA